MLTKIYTNFFELFLFSWAKLKYSIDIYYLVFEWVHLIASLSPKPLWCSVKFVSYNQVNYVAFAIDYVVI